MKNTLKKIHCPIDSSLQKFFASYYSINLKISKLSSQYSKIPPNTFTSPAAIPKTIQYHIQDPESPPQSSPHT